MPFEDTESGTPPVLRNRLILDLLARLHLLEDRDDLLLDEPRLLRRPPLLSSTVVWSPIPHPKEIGREEAVYRGADHRLPA